MTRLRDLPQVGGSTEVFGHCFFKDTSRNDFSGRKEILIPPSLEGGTRLRGRMILIKIRSHIRV